MIKSVVWSSMLDYPQHISTTLFIGQCSWDCDFCHNKPLIKQKNINFKKDVLPKLIKRKNFIDHIVISGGECTEWVGIADLIKELCMDGFTVGIHTNGNNPKVLEVLIPYINYVGMDIKTSEERYDLITNKKVNYQNILDSIEIIINSNIQYEFRTTVYPKFVDVKDCLEIAKVLKSFNVNEYILQQFESKNLDNCDVKPYSMKVLRNIKNECNKIIKTTIKGEF